MGKLTHQVQFEMTFALACDLDLELCLVPRVWVQQVIAQQVLKYIIKSLDYIMQMQQVDDTLKEYYKISKFALNLASKLFKDDRSVEYEARRVDLVNVVKEASPY